MTRTCKALRGVCGALFVALGCALVLASGAIAAGGAPRVTPVKPRLLAGLGRAECKNRAAVCIPDREGGVEFHSGGTQCEWPTEIQWGDGVTTNYPTEHEGEVVHHIYPPQPKLYELKWKITGVPIPPTEHCESAEGGWTIEVPPFATETLTSLSSGEVSGEEITVPVGSAVTDQATLIGETPYVDEAKGEVTYEIYTDPGCTELAESQGGTVNVEGGTVPESEAVTLPIGTYYWKAVYTGDENNGPSEGACGDEVEKVEAESLPHWYSDGKPIAEGIHEIVKTSGKLTLHLGSGASVACKAKDRETIENPLGGGAGVDSVTELVLAGCKAKGVVCAKGEKLEVVGGHLPWASELAEGPPIRDELTGLELTIQCTKGKLTKAFSVLKGSLAPAVGKSVLEFAAGSGELRESSGAKATVTGTDDLKGPAKDTKITAESP